MSSVSTMLWSCLVVAYIGLQISAEPNTEEVVSCQNSLLLECSPDQVVAAEIYTVMPFCTTSASSEQCACATESRECLMMPLTIVSEVNSCLWKQSSCRLNLMPMFTPCLVAKKFHCVNRTDILDICANTPNLLNANFHYITTPNYPSKYAGGLNCETTIRIPSGKSLYLRMISSHLPPKCDEDDSLDYLDIVTSGGDTYRVCGDVTYDIEKTWAISGDQVTLRFISRKTAKTYQGFVLYYELTEGYTRRSDLSSAGDSHRLSSLIPLFTVFVMTFTLAISDLLQLHS